MWGLSTATGNQETAMQTPNDNNLKQNARFPHSEMH